MTTSDRFNTYLYGSLSRAVPRSSPFAFHAGSVPHERSSIIPADERNARHRSPKHGARTRTPRPESHRRHCAGTAVYFGVPYDDCQATGVSHRTEPNAVVVKCCRELQRRAGGCECVGARCIYTRGTGWRATPLQVNARRVLPLFCCHGIIPWCISPLGGLQKATGGPRLHLD